MPSIAIVGASADRRKFGNIAVRAYAGHGYDVYPINPSAAEIEGIQAFPTIGDVPVYLERVSVYLPPAKALGFLDELAEMDVGQLWLNPGVDTPEVVSKAGDLGLNVVCECSIIDLGVSPKEYMVD